MTRTHEISPVPSADKDSIKGLVLPPMPEALRTIREEQAKAEPDVARIAKVISHDVSLAAEVLRVINSPAFGMRRPVASIPNAMALLGLANVANLVSSAALRASMSGLSGVQLERFWDTARDVALVSARVAKHYTGIPADTAYALGLFHDCGIPLLMALHRDYGAKIKESLNKNWQITDAETYHFGYSHAAIGYHVARGWNLPADIAQAILHHHTFAAPEGARLGETVRTLIAVLKVGEHVSATFRGLAFRREEEGAEWGTIQAQVLEFLEIGELEFTDLRDSLVQMLGE